MQYISPTLQFLTAVLIFGEPFGKERAIAFALIWVAVAVFVADSVRRATGIGRTVGEQV
jgi:chloramphenicol-sensitive protein RarD